MTLKIGLVEGKDCHCTHLAYAGKREISDIVTAEFDASLHEAKTHLVLPKFPLCIDMTVMKTNAI